MFCGGFRSDMAGTKATALDAWAQSAGRAFVRFDYRGHGASSGAFTDGTIGLWRNDALLVLDQLGAGPTVIVGSSMGAWIALLGALARPQRVCGLVLVAPAVDFTEALIWNRLPDEARSTLMRDGVWQRPSEYTDEPDRITRRLIEDGRKHLLLGGPIAFDKPVRILHGLADETVPWEHGLRTAEALTSTDVTVTLIKGGDHRLSDPAALDRLTTALDEIVNATDPSGPRGSSAT
ncbi:MAG: alpha/beta fold hydrolase [Rhodospirillales bacterium]|nr:MAG: alpha/beta fold hydrolase [Rhodospirillales bacterium]